MKPMPPSAGVIGWPIAHSKSPSIHRFWLGMLGLDGDYGRFAVLPENLAAAVRALPALGLRGVNVTVPHKVAVIAYLDRLDPLAARIGAVNTIVVEQGELVGYNTDAAGFIEPLGLEPSGASPGRAMIIGAGGAARAIGFALHDAGYSLIFVNRDVERARQLADDIAPSTEVVALADHATAGAGDAPTLLVNATSMGMTGFPPLPIGLAHVSAAARVYDIVYSPLETPLLAAARLAGHPTTDGLAMLIGQAAQAFELFFDVPPPRQHDHELRALLAS